MKDVQGKEIKIIVPGPLKDGAEFTGIIAAFDPEVGLTIMNKENPNQYLFCVNLLERQKWVPFITEAIQKGVIDCRTIHEDLKMLPSILPRHNPTASDCVFNR